MWHHPAPGSPRDAPLFCNLSLLASCGLVGYGVKEHLKLEKKDQMSWYCVAGVLGLVAVCACGFSRMCSPKTSS